MSTLPNVPGKRSSGPPTLLQQTRPTTVPDRMTKSSSMPQFENHSAMRPMLTPLPRTPSTTGSISPKPQKVSNVSEDDFLRIVGDHDDAIEIECRLPAMVRSMEKYMKAYVVALEFEQLKVRGAGIGLNAHKAARKKLVAEDCQCAPRVRVRAECSRFSMKLCPKPCHGGEAVVLLQVVVEANTDTSFWTPLGRFLDIITPAPDLTVMMLKGLPEPLQRLRKDILPKVESESQTDVPMPTAELIEVLSHRRQGTSGAEPKLELSPGEPSDSTLLCVLKMIRYAARARNVFDDEDEAKKFLEDTLAARERDLDAAKAALSEEERRRKEAEERCLSLQQVAEDERSRREQVEEQLRAALEEIERLRKQLLDAEAAAGKQDSGEEDALRQQLLAMQKALEDERLAMQKALEDERRKTQEAEERARLAQQALEDERRLRGLDAEERRREEERMRLKREQEEAERRRREEEEAERRRREEAERKRREEEEARRLAEEEARRKAEEEARLRAEAAAQEVEQDEEEEPEGASRTRVRVTVIRAESLRAADVGGKSDPYCMVHAVGKKEDSTHKPFKTDIVRKNLNPTWNQMHTFDACTLSDEIMFEVFDHDDGKKDDSLGFASLNPLDFRPGGFEGPIALGEKKRRSFFRRSKSRIGADEPKLFVKVEVLPMVKIPGAPRCFVKLQSAANLRAADRGGKSDPYCLCEVPGRPMTRFKTEIKKKTLNPEWQEEAEIPDYSSGDALQFQVYDYDKGSRGLGDSLGSILVDSQQFDANGFEGPLTLQGQGALAGSTVTVRIDVF